MSRALVLWAMLVFAASADAAPPDAPQGAMDRAESSVVRISILRQGDGGAALEGFGSGFVAAPHRIVTNYRVVAGAVGRGDRSIVVSPPSGSRSGPQTGRLILAWREADLAVIAADRLDAPALPFHRADPGAGAGVQALGYTSAPCMDPACTADEIVAPSAPDATGGELASTAPGVPGGAGQARLSHTGSVSPGDSGGPLVDDCGRAIGVNAWTGAAELDAPADRSGAIGIAAVEQFLSDTGVGFTEDGSPCASDEAQATAAASLEAPDPAPPAQAQAAGVDPPARLLPTWLVIAAVALAAGIGLALVVYAGMRRRRRRRRRRRSGR